MPAERPGLTVVRLAAVLLPAALVLHEAVYALGGGALPGAHGYLAVAVPVAIAAAIAFAVAALLLPLLGHDRRRRGGTGPVLLAVAILAIFLVQELAEALVTGGGPAAFGAALASGWMAPALALALGGACAALIGCLERTGELLVRLVAARPRRRLVPAPGRPARPQFTIRCTATAGLSFGFARRPPPASSGIR